MNQLPLILRDRVVFPLLLNCESAVDIMLVDIMLEEEGRFIPLPPLAVVAESICVELRGSMREVREALKEERRLFRLSSLRRPGPRAFVDCGGGEEIGAV